MRSPASWRWASPPLTAPDEPTYVTLDFEKGRPVAIDGEKMKASDIIRKLNKLGGENGIGLHRHRGEPSGRHEGPRRLRDSRRHHPLLCP